MDIERIVAAILMVVLFTASGAGLADSKPLTLVDALDLAVRASPDIAAQTAGVEAAQSSAVAAGRLPDPRLAVGLQNVPVNGADSWSLTRDFMTMRQIGVMQELPNGGVRQARAAAAAASLQRTQAERRVRMLAVRRNTALAWFNRYYLERRESLFAELEAENRLFAQIVQAQVAGGRGLAADTVVPRQEAAELADRRDELAGEIAKSKAALRRWIGSAADQPLAPPTMAIAIDAEHLRAHVHEHPELAVFIPMTEVAQAAINEAEALKRPDWAVELAYGRRGAQFSDMMSVQLTLGLPLFFRTRQDPQIAARRQDLARVQAEREVMLREHTQELEADLADYQTLTSQVARLRDVRLPLVREKVNYELASYRAGKRDVTNLLEARREAIDLAFKQIELQGQQAAVNARLYFAYGEGGQ